MALLVRKEQYRTMKFDFSKSSAPDLRNKLQLDKLDIINKNLLYLSHEVDKCVSMLRRMEVNSNLQKQVDDYFEDDAEDKAEHIPEELKAKNTEWSSDKS